MNMIPAPPGRVALYGLIGLVLLLSLLVRVRYADVALERDEGEHAYAAQVMLQGNPPWKLAYNMKLPGTDIAYALWLALLGQTAVAIRIGLLLVNAATILLVAMLGKRLFGLAGGVAAGACYGILSLSQNVLGTIAHSTHYVVLFAVAGTLLLLRAGLRPGAIFLSGLLFGVAFQMKQPGLMFAGFGTCLLLARLWPGADGLANGARGVALFASGVALPYITLVAILSHAGVFQRFWFWTVTLASAYTSQFTLPDRFALLEDSFPDIAGPNSLIWILAGIGIVASCLDRHTRRAGLFCTIFLGFSFTAVAAGGGFTRHYFVLMLPAVALGAGAWVGWGDRILSDRPVFLAWAPYLCIVAACAFSVAMQQTYLFAMSPYEFARDSWGLNPFPEAVKAGEYIRSHSAGGARVAVLGSEAEILFYSQRRSATGYLFTYGLMEPTRFARPMQREMIGEIAASRPEFIVMANIRTSWLERPESPREIFTWAADYLARSYTRAGLINLEEDEPTKYFWGPAALSQSPAEDNLTIYRRNNP